MAESRYNLVCEGEVEPGHDVAAVKKKLAAMLKLDAKKVERFFTGEPVVVKKGVDEGTAAKFQQAFGRAGAVCRVEPAGGEAPPPPAPEPTAEPPAPPVGDRADLEKMKALRTKQRAPLRPGEILLTNIETVPGREIVEHYGLVSGSTIRAKHMGKDIMAGLKNLVGGELKGYTKLLQESRNEAIDRMKADALQLGANAVINVRFSTSSVAQGAAELYVYGTAVKVT